jgi:hypothetical protein
LGRSDEEIFIFLNDAGQELLLFGELSFQAFL